MTSLPFHLALCAAVIAAPPAMAGLVQLPGSEHSSHFFITAHGEDMTDDFYFSLAVFCIGTLAGLFLLYILVSPPDDETERRTSSLGSPPLTPASYAKKYDA